MFKSAESATGGIVISGIGASMSWVDKIDLILRWGGGAVAIACGVMAFMYHYEGWKERRRKRERE